MAELINFNHDLIKSGKILASAHLTVLLSGAWFNLVRENVSSVGWLARLRVLCWIGVGEN